MGKIFRRYFEIFLYLLQETGFDNLHEMSNPVFWEKFINLSSAELAQIMINVKVSE